MLGLCALQLKAQAPDIKYPSPQTFIGVNNVTIKPINLGGIATSYTVNKPLPGTLVLDAATGIISGQASFPAYPDDYIITASNASGTSSSTIRIEISHNYGVDPRVTPSPIFSYPPPQQYLYQLNAQIIPLILNSFPLSANPYGQVSTLTKQSSPVFSKLSSIVEGPAGVFYVADEVDNVIKTIGPDGAVSIFAGTAGQTGIANGPKSSATFNRPVSLAFDRNFNLYVVDAGNNCIREIANADGTVSTFAGGGGPDLVNGTGAAAKFNNPAAIAIDNNRSMMYVADLGNRVIRTISMSGSVNTFAGTGSPGSANGAAANATFTSPAYIATDFDGNVYVSDNGTNSIRKISITGGLVSTIAGTGGPAASVNIGKPAGLKVSAAGNIYFGDISNNLIYELDSSGKLTLITGNAGQGDADGDIATAKFNMPADVAFTTQGVLYVADQNNQKIRAINLAGYSIDQPPPPGLTFNSVTGTFSGKTTAVSPPTYYLVTGHNQMGASATYVNIEVRDIPLVSQTLTFPPIAGDKSVCSTDFNLNVTSTAADLDNPHSTTHIKYTSSNLSVATVSPTGIVHLKAGGTTQITATQDGDTYHSAAGAVSQMLTVTSPPIPIVGINIDQNEVCKGKPVTFTAAISNRDEITNPTYNWQVNGKDVGETSNVYTAVVGRDDEISCFVTNHASCDVIGTIYSRLTLNETPGLEVHITPSLEGTHICPGSEITFTATANTTSTNLTYQWHLNGKNAGTGGPTYTSSTFADGDKIDCTMIDNTNLCQAPGTSTAYAIKYARPGKAGAAVSVSASSTYIHEGMSVTFTATTVNIVDTINYQWQVNGKNVGTNSDSFTTSTLKDGDVITCTAASVNTCTPPLTSQGIIETVLPPSLVAPPNTFTPNGDGINDLWQIATLNTLYPTSTVAVYNRYGVLMYFSKGYARPWDGTNNGKNLPAGTYYYVININPRWPKVTGYVAVVR